jgi:hypothetical protein
MASASGSSGPAPSTSRTWVATLPRPAPRWWRSVEAGKIKQAVKLYREQTGADMAVAIGALGNLRRRQ